MLYSFNDATATERHDLQYFEMFGNRGIYHKGWSAVTKHRTPWDLGQAQLEAADLPGLEIEAVERGRLVVANDALGQVVLLGVALESPRSHDSARPGSGPQRPSAPFRQRTSQS